MRFNKRTGILLGLALIATVAIWQSNHPRQKSEPSTTTAQNASERDADAAKERAAASAPVTFPEALTTVAAPIASTNIQAAKEDAFLLRNTAQSPKELTHNPQALILRNAWIDTGEGGLSIPEHLKVRTDPKAYIIQACGTTSDAFREQLRAAGGTMISYVPNNAYLVRISAKGARELAASACAVLPYEPYYKLQMPLLENAITGKPLAAGLAKANTSGNRLRVTLFPGEREAGLKMVSGMSGVVLLGEERSPFGPELIVEARKNSVDNLVALARAEIVQNVEPVYPRQLANDLARPRLGVSLDSVVPTNYLNLTGADVWVNVNDSGVDTNHPDLSPRVVAGARTLSTDSDGHGTHVAGTIASSGENGPLWSLVKGSTTNANFRGMAPEASILSLRLDRFTDAEMMETAARSNYFMLQKTNFISNNSWGYGVPVYNSSAATFDAIVRDAVPDESGPQSAIVVFTAGNSGGGNNNGFGGNADSVNSPGIAKNVITVGAIEAPRFITNEVVITNIVDGTNSLSTNTPWLGMTDSSNQVAFFSSRGNSGYFTENDFGRVKPDVVAPGTFVVSTRSGQWDTTNYYNPTNFNTSTFTNWNMDAGETNEFAFYIPPNCVGYGLLIYPNTNSSTPFPGIEIYTNVNFSPTPSATPGNFAGTNSFFVGLTDPGFVSDTDLFIDFVNTNDQVVNFDWRFVLMTTNNVGNYFQVLSNLNEEIGPNYRYESGTSMAAPAISGMLALMQEYFSKQTGTLTNPSPALMKALLINSARAVSLNYEYDIDADINYQGWGLPNLQRALPSSNLNSGTILLFEESLTTNCLATDESESRRISIAPAARTSPLRMTLVWTDPPGNPAVGVKLVNDLDLIVTNLDSGQVYFGNNFESGDFTSISAMTNGVGGLTNFVGTNDVVNNVENVYIGQPLGSNYAVTVLARRVNVNAVTGTTNGIRQDYALVISSGNLTVTNALTLSNNAAQLLVELPKVRTITNSTSLTGQRVGANSPLIWDPAIQRTNGNTNQWNFYVFTNSSSAFTNLAFATFIAPDLSGTAASGRPVPSIRNVDADIDLYVSTDSNLTNLDQAVIAGAWKSTTRGGEETIILSNGVAGTYYIGIKSEDQRAAEFDIFALATDQPFGTTGPNGSIPFFPDGPPEIPDGTPEKPGECKWRAFMTDTRPIRRILVQPEIFHELYGDLVVSLTGSRYTAILNNHTFPNGVESGLFANTYNDLDEGTDPLSFLRSDGPGDLIGFMTNRPTPSTFTLTVQDNALNHTGVVNSVSMVAELSDQNDGSTNFVTVCIPSDRSRFDLIEVPPSATNLVVELMDDGTASGKIISVSIVHLDNLRASWFSTGSPNDKAADLIIPAQPNLVSLSLNREDSPPLIGGLYLIRLHNNAALNGSGDICVRYRVRFDQSFDVASTDDFTQTNIVPILDDAVTRSTLLVTNGNARVVDVQVGVRIDHERASDLALHLVSPEGTRVLLYENRGGLWQWGLGTNRPPETNMVAILNSGLETVAAGDYVEPAAIEGWDVLSGLSLVVSNTNAGPVTVINDPSVANEGGQYLNLHSAGLDRLLQTTLAVDYELSYAFRRNALNPVSWWKNDTTTATDSMGLNNGIISGTMTNVPGEVNLAFNFDGTNYITVPASASLTVTNFTLEGWIYPTDSETPQPIFEYASASGEPGVWLWQNLLASDATTPELPGSLSADIVDTTGTSHPFETPGGVLTTNHWNHVALTFDGTTGIASLFVNGLLQAATNCGIITPATAMPLNFGYRPLGSAVTNADRHFTGQMDEIALYNFALSPSQILEIFSAGSLGKCGTTTPPTNCGPALGTMTLSNSPVIVSNLVGTNGWQTNFVLFTATATGTPLRFEGPALTNGILASNAFESVKHGNYALTEVIEDWTITSSNVAVITDPPYAYTNAGTNSLSINALPGSTNSILGAVTRNFPTVIGENYDLEFYYRHAHSSLTNWWPANGDAEDIINGENGALYNINADGFELGKRGLAFNFDGVDNYVDFGTTAGNFGTNDFTIDFWIRRNMVTNDFETVGSTNYFTNDVIEGWTVVQTNVAVVEDTIYANAGTHALALNFAATNGGLGAISKTFPTISGDPYRVEFVYRRAPSSLLHWWPGDSTTNDVIGGEHGVTNGGAFYYTNGIVNDAFHFDGAGDYVDLGTNAAIFGTNDFTIDFWLKTASSGPSAILSKRSQCGVENSFDIGLSNGLVTFALCHNTNGTYNTFLSSVSRVDTAGDNNGFHHVAVTRQGKELAIYINGVLDSITNSRGIANITNRARLLLGSSACLTGVSRFSGELDEIGIHHRAISTNEIHSLYLANFMGRCESTHPPVTCPAGSALVDVNGSMTLVTGDNYWQVFSTVFIASSNSATINITGMENSFWIDSFQFDGRTLRTHEAILSKQPDCALTNYFTISMGTNRSIPGQMTFEFSQDTNPAYQGSLTSSNRVDDGSFHHFAVTRERGTNITLYIDGELDAFGVFTNIVNFNNAAPLIAGSNACISGAPATPKHFSGQLDELGFHHRAISALEIRSIYLSGGAGRYDSSNPPTNGVPGAVPASITVEFPGTNGVTNAVVVGNNTWRLFRTNFIATASVTPISLIGRTNGLWVDALVITGAVHKPGLLLDSIVLKEEQVSSPYIHATFSENTNLPLQLIKYAQPPYGTNAVGGGTKATNSWEGFFETYFPVGQNVDSWRVAQTNTAIITEPLFALDGTNVLSLNIRPGTNNPPQTWGVITQNFVTVPGRNYELTMDYRRAHSSLINWWQGNSNTVDLIGGRNGTWVGTTGNYTNGMVQGAFTFGGTNDYLDLGTNAGNFGTNDFTVDFWIKTTSTRFESIMSKRLACSVGNFFDLRIGGGSGVGRVNWEAYSDNLGNNPMGPMVTSPVNDGNWHHIAFRREKNVFTAYVDGLLNATRVTSGITILSNSAPLRFGRSPCISIDGTFPFTGQLDEVGFHNRAISTNEIRSIYLANANGRCDSSHPPTNCPPAEANVSAQPSLENLSVDLIGTNGWARFQTNFTAITTNTTVMISNYVNGFWVDTLGLVEDPGIQFYLPEEALSLLAGERARGVWTLEIWDSRAGAFINAQLLSWELKFTFANITNPIVVTPLIGGTPGLPITTSVSSNQIKYFSVQVPVTATNATNYLTSLTGGALQLLFNQNALPNGTKSGDFILLANTTDGNKVVSTTGTSPVLQPGQRYYLGVRNVNTSQSNNFRIQVDFDQLDPVLPLLPALPNGLQVGSSIAPGNSFQYYQMDILPNASSATFEILHPSGNVDLYVSKGSPLPNTGDYDYRSINAGTSEERIVVTPYSYPAALSTGRWYVGVLNRQSSPVAYTLRATQQMVVGPGDIIDLVSGVPVNALTGPGTAMTNFYRFVLNGADTAALFEVYNLTADADLVLQYGATPSIGEYAFRSRTSGNASEQIVLRVNDELPDLSGEWFIGVPNNDAFNVNYTIRATKTAGGLLVSGQPPELSRQPAVTPTGKLQFEWNSVNGERYEIQGSTNLTSWTTIDTVTAPGGTTTFITPSPISGSPYQFYRIKQVP